METSHPVQRGITLTYDDTARDIDTSSTRRAAPNIAGGLTGGIVIPQGDDELDPDAQWLLSRLQASPDVSTNALPAMTPRAGAATRAVIGAAAPHVDVDLADDESAVLLVETDGVVEWQFPDASYPFTPPAGGRAAPGSATRRVRFSVAAPGGAVAGGMQQRNVAIDWALHRVRSIVLKFVARKAVVPIVAHMERSKRDGPVVISGSASPTEWAMPDDFAGVQLPAGQARLLLLVHGTFSSTVGGFGELCATTWGQAFLAEAHAKYDAVLGYDHRTLSVDPLDNAKDLYEALRTLKCGAPPHIDIVCHSRGGLVVRSLIERVLPASPWHPVIGSVVFVGATNSGTKLARPENWKSLIDLTTNLALAGRRALTILGAPHVGLVAGEIADGIGDFVRWLVDAAVTQRLVPGLAAMDPDGAFVEDINRLAPGDRQIEADLRSRYYAIESNFRPTLLNPDHHEPKEFPRRLALMFANGFIDVLMQEAHNDLVVDTASMTLIDGSPLDARDVQDFGTNAVVYHTNYFIQPETVDALARWLGLASPGAVEAVEDALVDRRIVVVDAAQPVGAALTSARRDAAHYVVVRNSSVLRPQIWYCAFAVGELAGLVDASSPRAIGGALGLADDSQSLRMDFGGAALRAFAPNVARPVDPGWPAFKRRTVVFDGALPMAVVPAADEFSPIDLMAWASKPTLREVRGGVRGLPDPIASYDMDLPMVEPVPQYGAGRKFIARVRSPNAGSFDEDDLLIDVLRPNATPLEAVERPLAAAAAAAPVVCNVLAEMPTQVQLDASAMVTVTLSVDAILAREGLANAGGAAPLDPRRPVTVEVRPRRGFKLASASIDDSRVVIPGPPAAGEPMVMDVELVATDVGPGEVLVIVRQGPVRSLDVLLKTVIIGAAGVATAPPAAASGSLPAVADLPAVATLEIWQQFNGNETRFMFGVNIPGVAFNRFESPAIEGDIAAWVDRLYKGIEQAWLGNENNRVIFHDNLKAKGTRLVADLVPLELQVLLWGLHLKGRLGSLLMHSDEPFVPWEIAYLDDPARPGDDKGCFFGQLGLCRWLYGSVPVTSIKIRAGRLRYLVPHYPEPSYRLVAAERDEEPMLAAMGARRIEPHYVDARDALKSGGFDLLHFAGHGAAESDKIGDSALLLEGTYQTIAGARRYVTEPLSVDIVATTLRLRDEDGNRPLVILNACQAAKIGVNLSSIGGFAPAFLGVREGAADATGQAGAFVSSLWSVGDQPASVFAQAFYAALQVPGGTTIGRAAIVAREAARAAGDATWLSYAVYAHPGCHVEFVQ